MSHAQADEDLYLDVAIIGAGWHGLVAANTYLKLQPNTRLAIFDKYDTVGGTWSKDRLNPNLVAQVEFGYFNYPPIMVEAPFHFARPFKKVKVFPTHNPTNTQEVHN